MCTLLWEKTKRMAESLVDFLDYFTESGSPHLQPDFKAWNLVVQPVFKFAHPDTAPLNGVTNRFRSQKQSWNVSVQRITRSKFNRKIGVYRIIECVKTPCHVCFSHRSRGCTCNSWLSDLVANPRHCLSKIWWLNVVSFGQGFTLYIHGGETELVL